MLSRKSLRTRRLCFETLEARDQPSVGSAVHLNLQAQASTSGPDGGLTPAEMRKAYGFDQLKDDGAGQTIAIVVAYDDPNIASDLATFDQAFGLAAPPSFNKADVPGTTVDAGWSGETALDVEWAHAVAPKANILLVEAQSASTNDLIAAVDYARQQAGVSVVSMSWGGSEFANEAAQEDLFTTPAGHTPVSFVAAAGDDGAADGAEWPASSPNVLAVGGTKLTLDSSGNYSTETGWSGSGGGYSEYLADPRSTSSPVGRGVPDVAYDADPNSGFAVYDSVADSTGRAGWMVVGGTSAGSPQWAGLLALVNQQRADNGLAAISNVTDAIYKLPSTDFHDITTGYNGYSAGPGYDHVTGLGSPIANLLVNDLANGTTGTTTTTPVSVTPPVTTTPTDPVTTTPTPPVTTDPTPPVSTTPTPSPVSSQPVWYIWWDAYGNLHISAGPSGFGGGHTGRYWW
ncbi:S53 family peptidase [Zavarzinella formosa]|uniref:S53 family peptidase n=1 Tax=Zavarzinella formosa TaxID=360055 RepID=UPI0002DB77BC|nr:S53 family peptidase [Zavarzinella formosa]